MMVPAIIAEERHKDRPKYIERRQRTDPEHPGRMHIRCGEDCIFTKKSGEPGKAGYGQSRDHEWTETERIANVGGFTEGREAFWNSTDTVFCSEPHGKPQMS